MFEVQRDSWLEFSRMSMDKLLTFIRNLCVLSEEDMKSWNGTVISRPGITLIGNIEVKAGIHTKETQDRNHVMHCKRYIELRSFCNDYNCESGLAGIKFPNVDK